MARRAAKVDGLPGGISSGAALTAAFDLACGDEMAGKLIVTIIPSFAERYHSTGCSTGCDRRLRPREALGVMRRVKGRDTTPEKTVRRC